jgi:hypothetical protein
MTGRTWALITITVIVVLVEMIFGVRDAWVSTFGSTGTTAQGIAILGFALLPVLMGLIAVMYSRRMNRDLQGTLRNAAFLGLCFGLPIGLVLVIGAAY